MDTSIVVAATLGLVILVTGCGASTPEVHRAGEAHMNPYPAAAETPTFWSSEQWRQQEQARR